MPPRFVEVSHVIEPGRVTYPGLPVPEAAVIVDHDTSRERYGGKSEFLIASLHLCGNTGTYVDSPVHRHRGALDLAGLPLERLAHLPVRLFDARSLDRTVGPQLFAEPICAVPRCWFAPTSASTGARSGTAGTIPS